LADALLWYSRKPGEANKSLNQDGDEKMKEKMKESLLMSFPQLKTHQLVTTTLNTFLLSYANFTKKSTSLDLQLSFCLYNGRF